MIDLDGLSTYSAIVDMKCGIETGKMSVGPSPFIQSVHVFIESMTVGPAGMNNLPPGAYFLQVVSQSETEHFELIKGLNKIPALGF